MIFINDLMIYIFFKQLFNQEIYKLILNYKKTKYYIKSINISYFIDISFKKKNVGGGRIKSSEMFKLYVVITSKYKRLYIKNKFFKFIKII